MSSRYPPTHCKRGYGGQEGGYPHKYPYESDKKLSQIVEQYIFVTCYDITNVETHLGTPSNDYIMGRGS